jgi:hypothetical protein
MSTGSSLGLPAPTSIDLHDQGLAETYAAFYATLGVTGETAVVCDAEFFSGVVQTREGGDGAIDLPRLQLLAALVCPGPEQMAEIRGRSFAAASWAHLWQSSATLLTRSELE